VWSVGASKRNNRKEKKLRVADYKDLRVYQLAFESAMEIYEMSKAFPAEERYSLTDQMRRSSRSVCANLAEAWRKRRYEAAFVSKLSDSDGEAAETEVHMDFALRCGYLNADAHAKLRDNYDPICAQLRKMIDGAPSWCGNDDRVREQQAQYFIHAPTLERSDASTLPRSHE
jgi:four helix bundle protein